MHTSDSRKQSRTEEGGVGVWAKQLGCLPLSWSVSDKSQNSLIAALDRMHSDVKGSDATVIKLNSPRLFIDGSKGFLNFSIHTKLL